MVTKLVHIELVSDLTSSAFIAALRRMAARKGSPKHLYSDNGTNFVGANKILQEEFEQIQDTFDQDFIKEVTSMEIEWHFNAPSWPTAGGLWEAAVKSLKYHLKRVVGDQKLTFEEFSTVLAQLEAILNSRPLCPLTEDPDDFDFLSPSSFINHNQDMTILETETDMRTRWHLTQKIVQDIWKRWHTEYLTQLSARSKWRHSQPNIQLNDIVTINDANLPPGKWAVGRVVQLHPGADGHTRVVTLKTKNGFIKRPVLKLSILPVNDRIEKQESRPKEVKDRKINKKVNHSISTLVMLLLSFMSILTTSHCSYNVTQLKDNQGLYLDKIANMQLIRDEWKIVTYYDMNSFWQGTESCSKYLAYLDQLCNKFKETSHCDIIQVQLQHEFSELQYYNHLLLSQHSSTRRARHLRWRKRGLINGVGYLANSLFGVLDERFADQYKQDIQSIQDNENHFLSLIKQQTTVIEAEYNVLKRNEQAINKQYKMLNSLSIKLDKMENVLLDESKRNRLQNDFSTGAIATSNVIRHLKTIQSSLLDTVTDVYHGRLNFHLLSPEQLKDTLNTISGHLSKDLSLPINNLNQIKSNQIKSNNLL
ncbi:hypothetical protein PYW08_003359 [Mythimna loreyi]|uniref:Uncharacterized protein n=1 Tax=Mythimna loreyi TaxID=667449 RepID=A0ACC2QS15_9NEOP|nr:hypothetical protein PYW08_003359 [Mythimna loreyi]